MPWLQLTISSKKSMAGQVEEVLANVGALSISYEDNGNQAILEPEIGQHPLWDLVSMTGLFDASANTNLISGILSQQLKLKKIEYRWELLEDRDWERESLKNYQPIKCGHRLWVCPSWIKPPEPESINLLLDPGLAFGTGTHPTTFLCLQWLDAARLEGKTIIDYGCGSGILAIASLLLGAKNTTCIDIDPQALMATTENAKRNGLMSNVIDVYLPEKAPNNPADIVIANILSGPLISLASRLASLTGPDGLLCLSGVIENQSKEVQENFSAWFEFDAPVYKENWALLTAKKRGLL
tara:strand:+ start:463 stop:1350 length:888 start_codon:yes stop_codon:yes gene_type:complete